MEPGRPVVLAISRQLGSGGAFIGQAVARRLSMKYVDREILKEAASQLGADDEATIEAFEERADTVWTRIARSLAAGAPDAPYVLPPPRIHEAAVAEVEFRIIRQIAERESAVIVGRGAAHILRQPYVVRLFVHASETHRISELERVYRMSPEEARESVKRSDRERARFIEGLIGRPWSDARLYDLAIDTSLVPIDLAADLVSRLVEQRRRAMSGVLDDDLA